MRFRPPSRPSYLNSREELTSMDSLHNQPGYFLTMFIVRGVVHKEVACRIWALILRTYSIGNAHLLTVASTITNTSGATSKAQYC